MSAVTLPLARLRGGPADAALLHGSPVSDFPVAAPQRSRGLWWLSPHGILLLVVPASVVLAVSISDLGFRLLYRTPKTLDDTYALLFLAAAAFLLLGIVTAVSVSGRHGTGTWPALEAAQLGVIQRAADVSFWLTVTGYVAFGLAGVARGLSLSQLRAIISSQDNYSGSLKETFAPVTGITTLTQVGVAYVILAGVLLVSGYGRAQRRRIAIVVVLALTRAFFLTERLALIEVLVPLVVVGAMHLRQQRGRTSGWLPAAPAFALPVLVAVFGLFEYSRSWVYFRSRTSSTFPEFVLDRLAGYYATAYNNGAIQLEFTDRVGRLPFASLEAFWTAPGIGQIDLYYRLTGIRTGSAYEALLEQHGTPEFNNPGGLAVPLLDFGIVGGLLAMLLAGLVVGAAYTSFRDGHLTGLLLYPLVFIGLLELPRYLYWTQGRVVPAVLTLLFVIVRLRRRRQAGSALPRPLPASASAPVLVP